MKNFPNQASEFLRLRATLATIAELRQAGQDVANDDLLGYELARRKQYTFRKFDYSLADYSDALEARIRAEKGRPASNQGARTNAREMRRTLVALNWLDANFNVTPDGEALLASAPGSHEERQMLAEALLQLEVEDSSGVSHPVRILLELLAVAPSRHRDGLELVLEAHNDSAEELSRITELYRLQREERHAALYDLGVTKTQIANAVKIFPTLARTAGLIVADEHGVYSLSPDGLPIAKGGASTRDLTTARARSRRRNHQRVTAETVASRAGGSVSSALSAEDQERATVLLAERTDRHQQLVRNTARMISSPGQLYENPAAYDLLWVPEDQSLPIVLFEMKTLDNDADAQTRLAVSQLSWYHFFDVSPEWETRAVIEVAVFDGYPGDGACRYLQHESVVGLVIESPGQWARFTDLEPRLPALLGLP